MKAIIVLPVDKVEPAGEFFGHEAVIEMAQLCERAGFDGLALTDHPCPTARWLDAGGHHAQDPFALLGFLAAATKKVRLQTGILVLPYRNPFITARACSSIDTLSNGRLILGVGAGYLKGEYKAVGADFDNRNDVTDEYLRALKAAWTQAEFSFEGTGYSARGNRILPLPVQKPHPPLWIGGNSKRAMRRAVLYGDAWAPFHTGAGPVTATARTMPLTGVEDMLAGLDYIKEYAAKTGRERLPDLVLDSMHGPTQEWNPRALIDQIGRLAELGVSWVSAHVEGRTRREWCDNAERYAKEVLANVAARA